MSDSFFVRVNGRRMASSEVMQWVAIIEGDLIFCNASFLHSLKDPFI